MRTRRGACYSCHAAAGEAPESQHRRKRRRTTATAAPEGSPAGAAAASGLGDMFDELPDDLVVTILADVAATAGCPGDLAGAMLACKRFRALGQSKAVLARASPRCLAVRAEAWSDDAHRFLQRCADAGNLEACYLLGMVRRRVQCFVSCSLYTYMHTYKEKLWNRSGSTAWAGAAVPARR